MLPHNLVVSLMDECRRYLKRMKIYLDAWAPATRRDDDLMRRTALGTGYWCWAILEMKWQSLLLKMRLWYRLESLYL